MFTKIIESELYGQILLIKDYEPEDDMDTIRFCVKPESLGLCEAVLKWSSEDRRDDAFDSVTVEKAEAVVGDIFTTAAMLSEGEDE